MLLKTPQILEPTKQGKSKPLREGRYLGLREGEYHGPLQYLKLDQAEKTLEPREA